MIGREAVYHALILAGCVLILLAVVAGTYIHTMGG